MSWSFCLARGERRRWLLAALALALLGCAKESPDRLVASAHRYLAQGETAAAAIQVRNALQQKPEDGALRLLLGRILLDSRDPVSAGHELRKALQYGQSQDSALPLLARAMLEQGKAEELLREFGPGAASAPGARALTAPESEAAFKSVLGQAQLLTGRTADAALSFRAAASAVPGDVPAQIGLIRVQAIEGKLEEAAQAAEHLSAAHPHSAGAHMLVSDLRSLRGDRAGSIAALEQAVRAEGRDVAARYALVAALVSAQRFDAAAAQLDEVRKLAKGELQIQYFDALIALGQNNLVKARDALARMLKSAPEHVAGLVLAAAVELQAKQPSAAETYLRRAITLAPQHMGARRMLVRTYLVSDQPAKALEALQPLLSDRFGTDPSLAMLAGETYLANGAMREASDYYKVASQQAAQNAVARMRLAQIALVTGDAEVGIKELEALTAAAGAPTQADHALITGYMRNNQLDRALQAAQRLAAKEPDRPLAYQLLGSVYVAAKDFSAAREQFTKALDVAPGYLPAIAGLSNLDIAANRPADARQRFDAVVAKEPANEQALLGLAGVMARTGAPAAEIATTLQRAIRANPQSSSAHLALIAHFLRLKEANLALSAAQEARAALPNDIRILYALGRAQEAAGQANQAADTFNRLASLKLPSTLPLMQSDLAERALRAGNLSSAAALYRDVVERDPNDFVALNNLAWAAGQLGDPKAIEYAQRAARIAPQNAAVLETLGSLLVAKGEVRKGVEYLRKAAALAPERPEIRLSYAKALIKAGQKDVARSELEALQATAADFAGKSEIAGVLKSL